MGVLLDMKGVEVPAAYILEECWDLIKTYEATKVPCMMLESWSFRRDNLSMSMTPR
jgi:thymidylate synthase